MTLGKCVTNSDGDVGYVVSPSWEDEKSMEWFVKVIWVDPLLDAAVDNELYPETLTITNEMESSLD